MQSIRGIFKDGVVHPSEQVSYGEFHPVIITFLDTPTTATTVGISSDESASGWDRLLSVIEECQMETGIPDLADQHDHYLYGTPKHDDQGT
ncbi:hypothetical protein [Planktothrix agardhii]|jgi:hypothetical protein|uniref:hypothetical protein n=1 Tax=Planktothrix agardhii TaxID=1160 RepID=UPI001D09B85F|nr:hypothetical protein [Planktothrix agardhii]MCB8784811.1 hypothetical protein [Planktothrix agardhii 1025]MCF3610974.1 hypothetical protein [Planktothrix agardhii 1027]